MDHFARSFIGTLAVINQLRGCQRLPNVKLKAIRRNQLVQGFVI